MLIGYITGVWSGFAIKGVLVIAATLAAIVVAKSFGLPRSISFSIGRAMALGLFFVFLFFMVILNNT